MNAEYFHNKNITYSFLFGESNDYYKYIKRNKFSDYNCSPRAVSVHLFGRRFDLLSIVSSRVAISQALLVFLVRIVLSLKKSSMYTVGRPFSVIRYRKSFLASFFNITTRTS